MNILELKQAEHDAWMAYCHQNDVDKNKKAEMDKALQPLMNEWLRLRTEMDNAIRCEAIEKRIRAEIAAETKKETLQ